ncbi:unnamed protein product, partial [Brassica rapa]
GDFGPRGLSVQYTQDVRVCPPAHTGRLWLSDVCGCLCVSVCPCVSVSTHRTSVAVHQYTYQHGGPWTQHAGPSRGLFGGILAHVGCLFSTHKTSVGVRQHTQDVRVCPSAHTGRLWLSVCVCVLHTGRPCVSVSTHRTSVAVRVCPSTHTERLWLSVSTHISTLYTQDVRGCPPAPTERLWLSISTHISTLVLGLSTLVLGLSTLALPVDCSGDFGPRGLSVQYTQDVCGCPSAHTGRPWVTSVAVCVCPCVSVNTQRTSVAVHQYTYQHAGPSRGQFG